MKPSFLFIVLCFILTACSTSKSNSTKKIDFRESASETESQQITTEKILPFPDLKDENWAVVNIYSSDITPYILLTSVHREGDNIVNYFLNIKSATGVNNLTAENINCGNKTYLQVAFADLENQKWSNNPNRVSKSINTQLNSPTEVRKALFETFCHGVFPKNKKELKNRLKT